MRKAKETDYWDKVYKRKYSSKMCIRDRVYPLELMPYILEQDKEIVHFVSKQI